LKLPNNDEKQKQEQKTKETRMKIILNNNRDHITKQKTKIKHNNKMVKDAGIMSTLVMSIFSGILAVLQYIHSHVVYLNSSKFFAGVAMILLNVGSKFITIKFSKTAEEYIKMVVSKQLLVFAMAWMGTRDIYVALTLTAVFTILSDYALDETSGYCIIPEQYRVLSKLMDADEDGDVSDMELNEAIAILDRAKKQKKRLNDRNNLAKFYNYMSVE